MQRRDFLTVTSALALGSFTACTRKESVANPPSTGTPWQRDLRFLVDNLTTRHPNPFFHYPRSAWDLMVGELDASLSVLSESQFAARLIRLVAILGDPHTCVQASPAHAEVLPFTLRAYPEGCYVLSTTNGHPGWVGTRVEELNGVSVQTLLEGVRPYLHALTAGDVRELGPEALRYPKLMDGAGLLPYASTYMVRGTDQAGNRIEGAFQPMSVGQWGAASKLLLAPGQTALPLYESRSAENYFLHRFEAERAHYVRYRACRDMPGIPFADLAALILAGLDANPDDRLIVDLRGNGGGSTEVFRPLAEGIAARPRLLQRGKLFGLMDNGVFSSALLHAVQLSQIPTCLLFGEPPRQAVNLYGEVLTFQLPNSGYTIRHSTRAYILDPTHPGDFTTQLQPSQMIAEGAQDRFGASDPVLQAALAYLP